MKPEDMVTHVKASKMAVQWVQDWIAETETDAEEFVLDRKKEETDHVVRH